MVTDHSPKVSICIPSYNQTVYLATLLRSIAAQTFTDYEIIVSDDSTTDEVKKLIDSFSFNGKLSYHRNQPSLGSPANWNAAIQKANGRYIKIMHHDDAFNSNTALAEMISFIEANGYDYVFSDSAIENVKDTGKNRVHRISHFDNLVKKPYRLFFGNSIGGPSSLLIKKEKLGALQYDPAFIWLVDVEYYIRLIQASAEGGVISKPLVLTHDAVEGRLTSTILSDFEIQIKEQAMLYNQLASQAPAVPGFFMQVYLARLLFKSKTKNKTLMTAFDRPPPLANLYFRAVKFKPLYFAYYIFTRVFDIVRKSLF
jgi:glycosyltransferase involved in cell wall biosynthesis